MRMIKDQEEIELICQSIHTTKRAIYNVMNHAKEHDYGNDGLGVS